MAVRTDRNLIRSRLQKLRTKEHCANRRSGKRRSKSNERGKSLVARRWPARCNKASQHEVSFNKSLSTIALQSLSNWPIALGDVGWRLMPQVAATWGAWPRG